jgi:hypothetical protein
MTIKSDPTDQPTESDEVDFFISYASSDIAWATWVATTLEGEGKSVHVQAWDSPTGENFVVWISRQMEIARRTIALCSPNYFRSYWCTQEWTGALAAQRVIPLRIIPCELPPILRTITYQDLFGLDEPAARLRLLQSAGLAPADRIAVDRFPGVPSSATTTFPGVAAGPTIWSDLRICLEDIPISKIREVLQSLGIPMLSTQDLRNPRALLNAADGCGQTLAFVDAIVTQPIAERPGPSSGNVGTSLTDLATGSVETVTPTVIFTSVGERYNVRLPLDLDVSEAARRIVGEIFLADLPSSRREVYLRNTVYQLMHESTVLANCTLRQAHIGDGAELVVISRAGYPFAHDAEMFTLSGMRLIQSPVCRSVVQ